MLRDLELLCSRLRRLPCADEAVLALVRDVFERPLLGLGDEERREDSSQHEEGEDLENVFL